MKRVFLLLAASMIALSSFAQTVLKESTHGVLPGYPNPMIWTEADNPGPAGQGVVWDFSALPQKGNFYGDVFEPSTMMPEPEFAKANTTLVEGPLQAFMRSSRKKLEVLGLRIPGSKMVRVYDTPLIKMKYPFRYGDKFQSQTTGVESYNARAHFDVNLESNVEADAYGTLILPGTTLKNVLRVVTTFNVEYLYNNRKRESVVVTYRWYVKSHRYPVLVLIFDKSANGELKLHMAAYNPVVEPEAFVAEAKVKEEPKDQTAVAKLSARPNPFSDNLTLTYTIEQRGNVIIALYNLNGQLVKTLQQGQLEAGQYEKDFSSYIQGINAGHYILRLEYAGKALSQKLIKI